MSAGGQATRGVHILMCGWTPWEGGPRQGEPAWAWGAGAPLRGLASRQVRWEPAGPLGLSPWRHGGRGRVLSRRDRAARLAAVCSASCRHLPAPRTLQLMNPRRRGRGVPRPPHCAQVPARVVGKDPGSSGTCAESGPWWQPPSSSSRRPQGPARAGLALGTWPSVCQTPSLGVPWKMTVDLDVTTCFTAEGKAPGRSNRLGLGRLMS